MTSMNVTLTDDVHWLSTCYELELEDERDHEHVAVYAIRSEDGYVLIDSGSFHHVGELKRAVDALTDGEGPAALILSHSDYPHSGNLSAFAEEWGEFELVASSGSPEIQGLPDARKCTIGTSMEVKGRTFSFIDPPLADRSHTTWIYDHGDGVLFTADGFGNFHAAGECRFTSADFDDGIPAAASYAYHRDELVWLRYVDPAKLRRAIVDIFDAYDVRWIAPIHGNPIASADVDRYLEALLESAARIASEYSVPEPDQ